MTDYFGFYGLPISFDPDTALIRQQFYAMSKKYHPDFYINESAEKQAEVLELSTLNNKAYQVLSDPQKRLHYILELKGFLEEGAHYALPQSFLMQMMEVNEALMDLQFDPDPVQLAALQEEVGKIEREIAEDILKQGRGFEALDLAAQGEVLGLLRDLYYRNQYLLRIGESIRRLSGHP